MIRTAPAAGEELDEGETFLLVVSEGPEFRVLPDLAGLPLADAEAGSPSCARGRRRDASSTRRSRPAR